jgi:hypothetical protein
MSKSAVIRLNDKFSKEEIVRHLFEFYSGENNDDELLLQYNGKWIWLFFENIADSEFVIQFSNKFEKSERLAFLVALHKKIAYKLMDSDLD